VDKKERLHVRRYSADSAAIQVINQRKERAWFDVYFVDDDGLPIPDVEFEIICSDGTTKSCKTDKEGYYKDEDVPGGIIELRLSDGSIIEPFTYGEE
jgi:hypothetical protein